MLGGVTRMNGDDAHARRRPSGILLPGQEGAISATIAYVGAPDDQVDAVSVALDAAGALSIIEPYTATQSKLGSGEKLTVEFPVSVSAAAKCGDVVKLVFELGGVLGKPLTDTDWDGKWHSERERVPASYNCESSAWCIADPNSTTFLGCRPTTICKRRSKMVCTTTGSGVEAFWTDACVSKEFGECQPTFIAEDSMQPPAICE